MDGKVTRCLYCKASNGTSSCSPSLVETIFCLKPVNEGRRGYSHKQIKSAKYKILGIFLKITGIARNPLKDFSNQFSTHYIELFPFKLPFKESVPQNIG